jgi:hypoxanthine-DNA glycosylase
VPAPTYEARLTFLREHHIALWDVLHSANRVGSSDAAIRDVVPNDLNSLLATHPGIAVIALNGRTAERMFRLHHSALPAVRGLRAVIQSDTRQRRPLSWREDRALEGCNGGGVSLAPAHPAPLLNPLAPFADTSS